MRPRGVRGYSKSTARGVWKVGMWRESYSESSRGHLQAGACFSGVRYATAVRCAASIRGSGILDRRSGLVLADHGRYIQQLIKLFLGDFTAFHEAQCDGCFAYRQSFSHRLLGDLGCILIADELI